MSPAEHLKRVEGAANQLKASLRQDLLYDRCEKLLKETTIACDSKLRVQPSRGIRKVHEHVRSLLKNWTVHVRSLLKN